ncbi:MAG: M20/M25/M40 family metallo-hydrolase [Bryobacteraceae bacterium]
MMLKRTISLFGLVTLFSMVPVHAADQVDLATLHKIKEEAFENSHVMDTMFYLTDVNGPRVTNSPGYFSAADWAAKQLIDWGIKAHQEKWPFGRGWQFTRFSAHLVEPQYAPLIGFPLAWTGSTNGTVTGEPMLIEQLASAADLEKYKGQLKGKIVLIGEPHELPFNTLPLGSRFTDAELADLSLAPEPGSAMRGPTVFILGLREAATGPPGGRAFQPQLHRFLAEEQPLLIVQAGLGRSQDGTVFGGIGGSFRAGDPIAPPTVVLTPEHYNRICRLLQHKIPVKLEFNVQTEFNGRTDSVNVIGDIEGNRKKEEVVMCGAHLDSWHGGTGATDNAAGTAVMMEAMRILKTLNLKMDRSVRVGLWGAEEVGSIGSKAYVKEHFGDPATMRLTSEHAKLSGYFNIDEGGGKIRGVYLQGNDMMRPIFQTWFAALKDLTGGTLSIRNTGGTDHLSFDSVGLPGFQFIQDPMDYYSWTHHSNMDVYDHIQKGDLMQMAAIVASLVYNTATREELLPRKPLPPPQPQPGERSGPGGPRQPGPN